MKKENHREFNHDNLIDFEEIKIEKNENLDDDFTSDLTGTKKNLFYLYFFC